MPDSKRPSKKDGLDNLVVAPGRLELPTSGL